MTIQTEPQTARGSEYIGTVSRKQLSNILNYLNFRDGWVVVNLHGSFGQGNISLRATPDPSVSEIVRLAWSEPPPRGIDGGAYQFTDFLIDRGSRVIAVPGHATVIDHTGISVVLPDRCQATSKRTAERFAAALVRAVLSTGNLQVSGFLQDFGGGHLRIRFARQDMDFVATWSDLPTRQVSLFSKETTLYQGECTVRRRIEAGESTDFVVSLIPPPEEIRVGLQTKTIGRDLLATCRHPLSDRIVRLRLAMLSYNSFVAHEHPEHVTFFRGLVIPRVKIDFGAGDCAECVAQVVGGEGGAWALSILDMAILHQRKVFSFVENETGKGSGVSTEIDPDDLVELLFESGFIYPKKYAGLAYHKERLRGILSKLYIDMPSVAQHFVQYNDGNMWAHIAMVRFYERSWVIHHHTATGGIGGGSMVLAQICRYIQSYGALPSTGMDYLIAYYRPENRFPDRVLGGLSRFLNRPKLSSVDAFAYLHLRFDRTQYESHSESNWQFQPASSSDLNELERFYDKASGGLAIKALGLEPHATEREMIDLDSEFAKANLRRRKSLFALKCDGSLKALIMAVDSDDGLNMSNLMKCVHAFVTDEENLPFEELVKHLNGLSSFYQEKEMPLLLFPSSYARNQSASLERVYNLLVFHVSVANQFGEFVGRLTNRTIRRSHDSGISNSKGELSGRQ
jgi:hypothetical protein